MTRQELSVLPGEVLLTPKEAAEFLSLQVNTLAKWRLAGSEGKLPFLRLGTRAVRYRKSDVLDFLQAER